MAELGGALVREGKSSGTQKVVEGMMGMIILGGMYPCGIIYLKGKDRCPTIIFQ